MSAFHSELAFVSDRYRVGLQGASNEWITAMHWDASSTTLLFHIHSKSAVFDNPIFVRLSFHLPDTPLCVMKYPHLTPVEADECNVIVDAVNASFRTRGSVLVRISSILKAVSSNSHLFWPSRDRPASDPIRSDILSRQIGVLSYSLMSMSREEMLGVDAMLSLLSVALLSGRRASVCKPTPSRLDNYDAMYESFLKLPGLKEICTSLTENQSPHVLETLPTDALHLLTFAVSGMPTKLRRVSRRSESMFPYDDDAQGYCMIPRDEFVVESPLDPQFDVDAMAYGTTVAYHGSPTDNIHSIIQNGLQSFSFSRRERNGAVFGSGIYFAESLRVAESFAQMTGRIWPRSELAGVAHLDPSTKDVGGKYVGISPIKCKITCVVVCDIVNHPSYANTEGTSGLSSSKPSKYYIVPDPRHVRIRRLFTYRDVGVDTEPLPDKDRSSGKRAWQSTDFVIVLLGAVLVAVLAWALCGYLKDSGYSGRPSTYDLLQRLKKNP